MDVWVERWGHRRKIDGYVGGRTDRSEVDGHVDER